MTSSVFARVTKSLFCLHLIATPNVVEYAGATPVFVDIDPLTFNIDCALAEAAISERTVGIIPVHLFGLCADMERINALAAKHGLWVVEDAACGFGARVGERHAGTFGTAGCFSFHPRKAITTGEGGMLTTSDSGLAERARRLRDHGADRTDLQRHSARDGSLLPAFRELGFNYRMTDIQAAIGLVQMKRADDLLRARRNQAARYDAALSEIPWLRAPHRPEGYTHAFQSYVTWFGEHPGGEAGLDLWRRRNRYMAALEQLGVATRQGTHAPPLQQFYREKYGIQQGAYAVAEAAEKLTISLPLSAMMTDSEQRMVVDALHEAWRQVSPSSESML